MMGVGAKREMSPALKKIKTHAQSPKPQVVRQATQHKTIHHICQSTVQAIELTKDPSTPNQALDVAVELGFQQTNQDVCRIKTVEGPGASLPTPAHPLS